MLKWKGLPVGHARANITFKDLGIMKVGDLVCMKIDTKQKNLGIVIGLGSQWTDITHPDSVVRVMWTKWPLENECFLFKNALHVVSQA